MRLLFDFSIVIICVFLFAFTEAALTSHQPEYMEVFSQHQTWEGHYTYNKSEYYCMLFVHTGHYNKSGGLLATFKDKLGTTLEIEGEQTGNHELEVKFTVFMVYNDGNGRFPSNFTFTATLYQKEGKWSLQARVTIPSDGLFGLLDLHQTDSEVGPFFDGSRKGWQYFLIIGVPLIMAVVGAVGTVGILYWAIKRGYIRHVPKSYKNFDSPVGFNCGKGTVHI
ncbi:uncharacterized protein LOC127836485 [Dreissena polymorpha]|uniref:uncharacterized protein LOC127836485 n=1 Tax=Dreissena polymorpha TaxID=45954 RepID=UPI0022647D26|nr:uncharacterized protein LOC127836485 [Dreissena polymorpha]